ncbi:hypothetical protein KEM55_005666 [Ascosphaera atra]|nr:hypothetical protein KEM55_005666 [Ascosphaera atra]
MDRPPCDEGGNASPTGKSSPSFPQVGIDITCARDPTRRRAGSSNNDDDGQPKTEKDLQGFIDIFSEVFSDREIEDMKTRGTLAGRVHPAFMGSQLADCTSIEYRLRLFYTYWALKEAYIKMTGEALLAPWLRDLEFVDVEVPERPSQSQRKQSTSSLSRNGQMTPISPSSPSQPQSSSSSADDAHTPFGPPHETVAATLNGAKVDNVRLEVAAFESDYIFATAARGRGFGPESQRQASAMRWDKFRAVDIARDVAPCATGTCMCLL